MSKVKGNKASNPLSPHSPKTRAGGSVVKNQATGKGGFKSTGDTHTSTMQGILTGNFENNQQ